MARDKIHIALLGGTGSIGTSTLSVIQKHPDLFELTAVSAHTNTARLQEIAREFHPAHVCLSALEKPASFPDATMHAGQSGLVELATLPEIDIVVVAVVGFAALRPVFAAAKAGKQIACANKEALVCAGDLIIPELSRNQLIPVDSEHSAIFQCLEGEQPAAFKRIWLTCSGGPFRTYSKRDLANVTAKEALKHPTWQMGDKITIDSATLMNKGLEVIEAHHLFQASYDAISVLIHPESLIHSMVEFQDGSVKAQAGPPDMRIPIQYALTYPARISSPAEPLDFYNIQALHFLPPNMNNFRCLEIAYDAGRRGGTAPCIMNAANEVANKAYRDGLIGFLTVSNVIEKTLNAIPTETITSIDQLEKVDETSRAYATRLIKELT